MLWQRDRLLRGLCLGSVPGTRQLCGQDGETYCSHLCRLKSEMAGRDERYMLGVAQGTELSRSLVCSDIDSLIGAVERSEQRELSGELGMATRRILIAVLSSFRDSVADEKLEDSEQDSEECVAGP